ncbi:hypothetical protein PMIN01_11792 [Paraphaeosphaeria minitans]|uniref:J domain-containing protein n=1 Tax=Paraphaeosphaeria minitans TaxID=565426 RepID=A0A9P6G8X1_9PLEO|nr:hypothetical protein PMIN01_11792 [Paraphaeosphaeria minitans]
MVGCSEISRLAGLRAADFKQFDFFNHLGMNPHIETLELGDSLNRRFKYVAVRLHPDKCGNNPPNDINFILLTSFVNAWKVADDVVKAIVIQDINTKAKAGWRSTWQMTDKPGKWTAIKWTAPPVAPGVHIPRTRSSANKDVVDDDSDVEEVVNPFGFRQSAGSWASTNNYHRKRAASPLQAQGQQKRQTHRADDISDNDANHVQDEASPQLTERRRRPYTSTNTPFPRFDPRTLTTDTTTNDARQQGQRSSAYPGTAGTTPQDSIPILSDDDEELRQTTVVMPPHYSRSTVSSDT